MKGAIGLGVLTLAVFFGGIGSWAALAPLSSAVIANGMLVVHGNLKTVQHQDGGIVDALLVQEGSTVRQGQVLIRLDDTEARAAFNVHKSQLLADEALSARDLAELSGAKTISFPASLSPKDPVAATVMQRERVVFRAHRDLLARQEDVVDQRIDQAHEEQKGAQNQLQSARQQLVLARKEQQAIAQLARIGLASKNRLLELSRSVEALRGQVGQLASDVARFGSQAVELKAEKLRLVQTAQANATHELRQAQLRINDVLPRIAADRDRLRRLDIRAPISGKVVNLSIFTKGGVVQPGRPLMDIVPSSARLVAEVDVQPQDVENLHVGQAAEIVAVGFPSHEAPPITGKIRLISADRITNPRNGRSFFKTDVTLVKDKKDASLLAKLVPGMPVQVVVPTKARTPLDYLVGPLRDSFRVAWREQ